MALDVLKQEACRSVTYIVLGPMTTLAHLCRNNNDVVKSRIGRVIAMGGALDVPGNTSPTAECESSISLIHNSLSDTNCAVNFFADPYAVQELLVPPSGSPALPLDRFLLLPLDTTTPHELPFPYYATAIDKTFVSAAKPSIPDGKSPIVHFTSAFLEKTRDVMISFGKDAMELHDIVAVWCAIENPPETAEIAQKSEVHMPVLQEGWGAVRRKFEIERCVVHICCVAVHI